MKHINKSSILLFALHLLLSLIIASCRSFNSVSKASDSKDSLNHTIHTKIGLQKLTNQELSILLPFENKKKWGYMNLNGRIIIPNKYQYAGRYSNGLAPVKQRGKFGFVNWKDSVVISFKYDFADNFSKGLARVSVNTKDGLLHGFVDTLGKVIIPISYTIVEASFDDDFIQCTSNDSIFLYNNLGESIYSDIIDIGNKIGEASCSRILVKKNHLFGYIDYNGKWIVKPVYKEASMYSDSIASVRINSEYFFIDINGQRIIDESYSETLNFSEGYCGVCRNGKCGVINTKGQVVIPFVYNRVSTFKNGFARALIDSVRMVLINFNGEIILHKEYYYLDNVNHGVLIAKLDEASPTTLIDTTGRMLFDNASLMSWINSKHLAVLKNGRFGLIDLEGNYIIPPQYIIIEEYYRGEVYKAFYSNSSFKYFAKSGDVIQPIW